MAAVRGRSSPPSLLLLWMSIGGAAALQDNEVCYILDGILFVYGIILTALYCKFKICEAREAKAGGKKADQTGEEGIYTDLTPHAKDTYETIGMRK
ncbi:unnamed protein product [Ophioblennius macclurei]